MNAGWSIRVGLCSHPMGLQQIAGKIPFHTFLAHGGIGIRAGDDEFRFSMSRTEPFEGFAWLQRSSHHSPTDLLPNDQPAGIIEWRNGDVTDEFYGRTLLLEHCSYRSPRPGVFSHQVWIFVFINVHRYVAALSD